MHRHCILCCLAVHLFGIVWASGLIYKDTMYRSFTPELFGSITSIVVFIFFLNLSLFVSQHTVAVIRTVLLSLLFIIVTQRQRAHRPLRALNPNPIPAPIHFYYYLPSTTRQTQEWMLPGRSMTNSIRTMGFRCPRCRQCLPHFHPAQERPH